MASVADFLAIRAETKSEKTLENQKTKRRREENPEQIIEQLWTRVYELEDIQQRVENNAAEAIEMAEELAIARDQAESALKQAQKYQQKIKELALYDPLTGLANRNEFNRRFEDAIKIARREDSLVTLLLFDLDHFKDINDSYGHPVGDELLKYVASQLKEATREMTLTPKSGPGGSSPMRLERWSYPSWPVPASGSRCSSGAVVGYRRSRCTRIAQPWPRAG